MSSNGKIVRHPSLEGKSRKTYLAERKFDSSKTAYSGSPRNPRRISDPGLYRTHNSFSNLQSSSSRFSRLGKKANGVVSLNTECMRKYRSWSDPNGDFNSGNADISSQTGTFYKDLHSTRTNLRRLGKAMNPEKDNFEEKSFCDSLSSFPCSSITSRSSSVLTEEGEDWFIAKRGFSENTDISSQTGTFYKDLHSTWTPLSKGKAIYTEKDNFEGKSFCDSLSSFPCSSITSRSSASVLTEDGEDYFISKRKTVLNWVHNGRCEGCNNKKTEFQSLSNVSLQ